MELLQKNKYSLQNRVNDYLRVKPNINAVEEAEVALVVLFDQLQKAEESLRIAQKRVEHLKWELAKAKS